MVNSSQQWQHSIWGAGQLVTTRCFSRRLTHHTILAVTSWLAPGLHRTTSNRIGPHRITSDQFWQNCTDVCNGHTPPVIPVVNHVLAHSRKCITYMMLEENPLFHTAAVQIGERVPSGLQRPTYWELYCFTDCWRHVRNRWPRPNTRYCFCGGLTCSELIACRVACLPEGNSSAFFRVYFLTYLITVSAVVNYS